MTRKAHLARIDTPLKLVLDADGRRQSWLAERLDVDPRQVWGWVHGIHEPADETKARIASLLGRAVQELFHETESSATPASADANRRHSEERAA